LDYGETCCNGPSTLYAGHHDTFDFLFSNVQHFYFFAVLTLPKLQDPISLMNNIYLVLHFVYQLIS